jgi:hypothetical protein
MMLGMVGNKMPNKIRKSIFIDYVVKFILAVIVLAGLFDLIDDESDENKSVNNLEKMAIFSTNFGYKCGLEGNSRLYCQDRMKEIILNAKDKQK